MSIHQPYRINSLSNHRKRMGFSGKMPTRNICGEKCTTVSQVLVRDSNLQGERMWLLSLHKATEIIIIRNYIWALGRQLVEKEEKAKCRSKLYYVTHYLSHLKSNAEILLNVDNSLNTSTLLFNINFFIK